MSLPVSIFWFAILHSRPFVEKREKKWRMTSSLNSTGLGLTPSTLKQHPFLTLFWGSGVFSQKREWFTWLFDFGQPWSLLREMHCCHLHSKDCASQIIYVEKHKKWQEKINKNSWGKSSNFCHFQFQYFGLQFYILDLLLKKEKKMTHDIVTEFHRVRLDPFRPEATPISDTVWGSGVFSPKREWFTWLFDFG